MAAKKTELTQEQRILLSRKGFYPDMYEVLQDYPHSMLVRNIATKEPAVIYKD